MLWFRMFVTVRFGEPFGTRSDQSEVAEFGGEVDHWPGEESGVGVR